MFWLDIIEMIRAVKITAIRSVRVTQRMAAIRNHRIVDGVRLV